MASVKQDGISVTIQVDESTSVKIAFHGGLVHSYIHKGVERLFCSSLSSLTGPAAIRGGIPICWPCFGPPSPEDASRGLKQHGFARTSRFEVEDTFVGEGIGRAVFRLESTPATLQAYRHEFALIYSVTLSPTSLSLVLRCEAKTTDLTFTTALHSYFQLPSTVLPAQVLISPLQGLTYVNKVLGGVKAIEEKNEVAIVGEIDRVYHNTAKELFMSFPNSRIRVTKFNLSDVVVWNPATTAGRMADLEIGGENRFVCLEPAQVNTVVTVAAGGFWEGGCTIVCEDQEA